MTLNPFKFEPADLGQRPYAFSPPNYEGSSKVVQESFMMLARLIIRVRFTPDMLASETLPA